MGPHLDMARKLRWKPATRGDRKVTVARWIFEQVKKALLSGQLRSGDFLGTEHDLAAAFDVSRIAARDALQALQAQGIITSRPGPGGGARIAEGNPGQFAEALAIQLTLVAVSEDEMFGGQTAIEVMAAGEAARMATPEDIAHLERLIQQAIAEKKDKARFKQLSWDFHHAVTIASKNRVLISLRESIVDVLPSAYAGAPTKDRAKDIIRCHRHLLELIKAGNQSGAREAMLHHLEALHHQIQPPRQIRSPRLLKGEKGRKILKSKKQ